MNWTTERIGPSPHLSVDHVGQGDLLVFLHGIGGNKRNWHPNLTAFGEHWHAVAWDARGYGESDDYEGPLDFLDYSHDVSRVLDHFGASKAHIIGLSMGGRIALDFAALYPSRLLTLDLFVSNAVGEKIHMIADEIAGVLQKYDVRADRQAVFMGLINNRPVQCRSHLHECAAKVINPYFNQIDLSLCFPLHELPSFFGIARSVVPVRVVGGAVRDRRPPSVHGCKTMSCHMSSSAAGPTLMLRLT